MALKIRDALSYRAVAGAIIGVLIVWCGNAVLTYTPPVPLTNNAISAPTLAPEHPSRIIIPKLFIDASIQSVGRDAAGNMGTPSGSGIYTDVAWYRYGARPGDVGNAVLAGHVDGRHAAPAVFHDLYTLVPGDVIFIKDTTGTTFRFVVETTEEYGLVDSPLERIFGTTTDKRLNLITCAGDWLSETQTYSKRHVVYAKLQQWR